ncbi:hypothetical protein SAMN04489740_1170 [Arthrobacter alpinus]|uniref:Uncharacterized protein n=1 Tax=Arthrobacter alpinus TaxID=656366 RepID=A0A1H5I3G8_9MICC|nr:hypothetical protein SAMN04489740_1170 [Arthrobacter alpinus]
MCLLCDSRIESFGANNGMGKAVLHKELLKSPRPSSSEQPSHSASAHGGDSQLRNREAVPNIALRRRKQRIQAAAATRTGRYCPSHCDVGRGLFLP